MNEQVDFVTMSNREKYLYDLQGFLVMKDFLSQEEVKAINDAWGVRNTTERCGRCPTEPCRDSTFRTRSRGVITWDSSDLLTGTT